MTQRTQVLLIDDLDGSSADETVAFGLDGSSYEIDLSSKNASQLRETLANYVAHGRKLGAIRSNGRRRPARTSGADTSAVREWARGNGYAVNDRGRISTEVLDAFAAAH
jgi:Lsr2